MSPEPMLSRLVSFPSVVGQPNGAIIGFVREYLPGPESDRSNLFATIGPAGVPGFILSGHLDVGR